MALIPTRRCNHLDWYSEDQIEKDFGLQFCNSCGLSIQNSDVLPRFCYRVQLQPSTIPSRVPMPGDYVYRQLNLNDGRHIRIMVLAPGNYDDELHCYLEEVNLQLNPAYEAISYTWADESGNDDLSARVKCGNQNLYIRTTRNCEAALRRLREVDCPRRLWIDSICIDQANIRERNHQVMNMIPIFQCAQQVIIYVGEGSEKTRRVVEYLSSDSPGVVPSTYDVLNLFQSRWFHRVWILQEVAVAKAAIIVCGPEICYWRDLVSYGTVFSRMAEQSITLPAVLSFDIKRYGIQRYVFNPVLSHSVSKNNVVLRN
jgi:hypothetical protein